MRSLGGDRNMDRAASKRAKHDTTVSVRMSLQTKALIERAAVTSRKTFSAFVTESASQQAADVLLDQCVFNLDAEQAEAFAQVLANPPAPTAKLRELMQSKAPWEK
jgi:uncharacterized protein (DUF1778 family)